MNTKNIARRMVSKIQKVVLAVMIVVILLGSFPVGQAHAQVGAGQSRVYCKRGYYNYAVSVQGSIDNQWVAIRYKQITTKNGYQTVVTSGWTVVQAKGAFIDVINTSIYAVSGAVVEVWTEIYYYNHVTRLYEPNGLVPTQHFDYYNRGPYASCLIY